ncbi:MAG: hypothetical protein K2H92_01245 [Bacteroidaceae bacterium]|nr:hypothetical protein [Bacteroidaceae bacterium]
MNKQPCMEEATPLIAFFHSFSLPFGAWGWRLHHVPICQGCREMLSHCSVMAKKHQKILQIRDKVSIFATSSRRDRLSGGGKGSSATAGRCRGDAIYGKAFITRFVLNILKA